MKPVDLYARVRHACRIEGLSQHQTARRFGLDPKTVRKMLSSAVPPGYRRSKPPSRPKLGPVTPIIAEIRAAGAVSLREIAAGLNSRGILTARGGSGQRPRCSRY